ncbi:hypothetical protein FRX96_09910 (plasmid) [Spiroplasma citri]|nr:hypothetical protein FRX96_09910 [Spiroplasma citri]
MLAVSAVAPLLLIQHTNQKTDQLTLSYTEQQIKNDELPIPNAGNWDLSTGPGYFAYFLIFSFYFRWRFFIKIQILFSKCNWCIIFYIPMNLIEIAILLMRWQFARKMNAWYQ